MTSNKSCNISDELDSTLYPESEPPTAVVPVPVTPPTMSVLSKSKKSVSELLTVISTPANGGEVNVRLVPDAVQLVNATSRLFVNIVAA